MSSADNPPLDMTAKKQKPNASSPSLHGKVEKPSAKPAKPAQQAVELFIMNGMPKDPGQKTGKQEYLEFLSKLPKKVQKELLAREAALVGKGLQHPPKYRLLTSDMDDVSKTYALQRMQAFQDLLPDDNEYPKQKEWFDTLLRVPFGRLRELPVTKHSESICIQKFLHDTQKHLDETVYGMQNAKAAILQLMAQWITNPDSSSHAIAFSGEKGLGKTKLAFHGIAKALDRPFHLISLGGSKDSSYLSGHEYTYLGSHCGHLVDILIASDCLNPIIFFDELDKVSDSAAGQELIGNLIHLIDATQNHAIKDRYFGNINFDFSHAMFVFSFNDASKVDPILLDRMQTIHIEGYKTKDKLQIVKNFFLPDITKNVGLPRDAIVLQDDDMRYIIDRYASQESGVRTLRRCIDTVYMKVNMLLLNRGKDYKLELHYDTDAVELPFVLTRDLIDKMLDPDFGAKRSDAPWGMYV